jgi:hypothetical protein
MLAMRTLLHAVPVLALAAGVVACGPKPPEPEVAPPSGQAWWTRDYPADVTAAKTDYDERERDLDHTDQQLPTYPDKLKTKDSEHVMAVLQRAEDEGKSPAYAERMKQIRNAKSFLTGHEVVNRVAGACQAAAKQAGCTLESAGAISAAIKDGVDKEGQKRLRGAGEAHLLLDRYRTAIGKDDAKALETQADDVAYASYLSNVALPDARAHLESLVGEADRVRSQGKRFVDEEKAYQAEAGRTDADKKASAERVAAMQKTLSGLDASVADAQKTVAELEKRVADAQKRHDEAFSALEKGVKKLGAK